VPFSGNDISKPRNKSGSQRGHGNVDFTKEEPWRAIRNKSHRTEIRWLKKKCHSGGLLKGSKGSSSRKAGETISSQSFLGCGSASTWPTVDTGKHILISK